MQSLSWLKRLTGITVLRQSPWTTWRISLVAWTKSRRNLRSLHLKWHVNALCTHFPKVDGIMVTRVPKLYNSICCCLGTYFPQEMFLLWTMDVVLPDNFTNLFSSSLPFWKHLFTFVCSFCSLFLSSSDACWIFCFNLSPCLLISSSLYPLLCGLRSYVYPHHECIDQQLPRILDGGPVPDANLLWCTAACHCF